MTAALYQHFWRECVFPTHHVVLVEQRVMHPSTITFTHKCTHTHSLEEEWEYKNRECFISTMLHANRLVQEANMLAHELNKETVFKVTLTVRHSVRSHSRSFGGDHPVIAGIRFVLSTSSKGTSRWLMSGTTRLRYVHLLSRPCVRAEKAA